MIPAGTLPAGWTRNTNRENQTMADQIARITTEGGEFNEVCEVATAEAMLRSGLLRSFDGVAAAERCYTADGTRLGEISVFMHCIGSLEAVLSAAKARGSRR